MTQPLKIYLLSTEVFGLRGECGFIGDLSPELSSPELLSLDPERDADFLGLGLTAGGGGFLALFGLTGGGGPGFLGF